MKVKYLFILLIAFSIVSCKTNDKQKTKKEEPSDNPKNAFVIHTSFGDMKGRLYDETPLHRDNFIKLVNEGFYDSLLFHRVIKNFMIQGGDPDSKNAPAGKQLGNGGPGYTIPAEFNPKFIHKKGALSAARMGDNVNPKKESSGSQFYIVQGVVYDSLRLAGMEQKLMARKSSQQIQEYLKLPENIELRMKLDSLSAAKSNQELHKMWESVKAESKAYYTKKGELGFTELQKEMYSTIGGTPHLDGDYTVFGEIYEGLEIIDLIANVKGDRANRPLKDVKFTIEMLK
jgi:peptidylprolyl isomerase